MINDYQLTPSEKRKVNELKFKFHYNYKLYYSLPADHEDREKVYEKALELLHERLYIILGV